MEYIKFSDIGEKQWDTYLENIQGSTFNYLSNKMKFDLEYSIYVQQNESFLLISDKKAIGVAIVYIEELNHIKSVSWSGGYLPAPVVDQKLSYSLQEKYMAMLLKRIEEIGRQHKCKKILMRMDPLTNPDEQYKLYNYNYMLKEIYEDRSSLSQILDLRKEENVLFSDIRKGHKSDIKKADYSITFFDKENITEDVIKEYRRIYECDAGMVTRNSQMSHHYLKFVQDGNGLVGIAKKGHENVAVIIVTLYKDTAYYSSYAELTDKLEHISVGHVLQWETILELKKRGIAFYEIGEQVFGKTHYSDPDKKLINISRFKRGFGGYTVPFYRGIKELG